VWAVRYLPKKYRSISFASLVAGVVLCGFLAYQISPIRNHMIDRMGHSERFDLWRTDLEIFYERPLFGIGWRKTPEAAQNHFEAKDPGKPHFSGHAHNNLIEMLTGTGLVGTLCWILFNGFLFLYAWRHSRGSTPTARYAWAFFCAWLALHLNGLTQMNFWEGKVLHQMMLAVGLLFALCGFPAASAARASSRRTRL
jgi:O-antigen ligase